MLQEIQKSVQFYKLSLQTTYSEGTNYRKLKEKKKKNSMILPKSTKSNKIKSNHSNKDISPNINKIKRLYKVYQVHKVYIMYAYFRFLNHDH